MVLDGPAGAKPFGSLTSIFIIHIKILYLDEIINCNFYWNREIKSKFHCYNRGLMIKVNFKIEF